MFSTLPGTRYILVMNYLKAHWRGDHSMFRSFWINLVAVRLLLWMLFDRFVLPGGLPLAGFWMYIFLDAAIFVWQAIGVIRSGEKHISGRGGMAQIWGSYAGLCVAVFATAAQWLGAFNAAIAEPDGELFTTRMDRLHASNYALALAADETALTLDGIIDFGATKAVQKLLELHPDIEMVVLNSSGGNIYEARGLAKQILSRKINTHTVGECSSACTIVFASGERRTLSAGARLGFHQYHLESDYLIPNVTIREEQEQDRRFFESRHIKPAFLDRIFNASHDGIWYPERSELISADVVHSE
jgi:hypothetical protein